MEKKETGAKKFTDKEEPKIIKEVSTNRLKSTLEKYSLFPCIY
jgi:hypothetical protein